MQLINEDVVHGFAMGGYPMTSLEIMPVEFIETKLTFDKPGEYTFFALIGAAQATPECVE